MDESADALVGNEHQDVVDSVVSGLVDVVAFGQFDHAVLHGADERFFGGCFVLVGVGSHVLCVLVERELDVHEQDTIGRNVEAIVGPSATVDRRLFRVVDTFDESGGAEHVFGETFAPLPACLRTGQDVVQLVGSTGQGDDGLLDGAVLLGGALP